VLALAPGDPEANQAVGNVQSGGSWVSQEESYRARGYVKFEGEWMTPSEQQAILQQRSAAADANRARQQESQARQAQEQARQQQQSAPESQEGIPLYWGWGTGPAAWPGTNFPRGPMQLPARND
jgi:hypothetical protein